MKKHIKKYGFLIFVVVINAAVLIVFPHTGIKAMNFTGKNFLNFLFMLTPIFILIGLMDVWIERDKMIKIMGEKSGIKGVLIAIMMGVITAVPLYALLPVAGVLLKKGSKIYNVLIFLCSSASIRIPLLLFEVSSLGLKFTLLRLAMNVVVVFAIAFIVDKMLSEADKKAVYENTNNILSP